MEGRYDPLQPRHSDGRFAEKAVTEAAGGMSTLPVGDDIRQYNYGHSASQPPIPVSAEQVYDFWAVVEDGGRSLNPSWMTPAYARRRVELFTLGRISDFEPRLPEPLLEEACLRAGNMYKQCRYLGQSEVAKLRDMTLWYSPGKDPVCIGDLLDNYDCLVMADGGHFLTHDVWTPDYTETPREFWQKAEENEVRLDHGLASQVVRHWSVWTEARKNEVRRIAERPIDYSEPYDSPKNFERFEAIWALRKRAEVEEQEELMNDISRARREEDRRLSEQQERLHKAERRARWNWLLGRANG